MPTGTVISFSPAQGYGFIDPEDGTQDVFVHISAVENSGLTVLRKGQKVQYELVPGQDGKFSAGNLIALY